MVDEIGNLLLNHFDLLVANILLGAEIAGEYGSVLLFSTLLLRLATTVSSILKPTILAKYAHGNLTAVNKIVKRTIRFLGLLMALPIGLLCGLSQPLLVLWLGPSFQKLAGIVVALTAHLVINLAVQPLFGLNLAFNKVTFPSIVTLLAGGLNVFLAFLFVKLGWGLWGIAASSVVTLTFRNAFFTPIYVALIQKLPWWTFMLEIIPGALTALLTTGAAYGTTQLVNLHSWTRLISFGSVLGLIYALLVCFVVLDKEERRFLVTLLPVGINGSWVL